MVDIRLSAVERGTILICIKGMDFPVHLHYKSRTREGHITIREEKEDNMPPLRKPAKKVAVKIAARVQRKSRTQKQESSSESESNHSKATEKPESPKSPSLPATSEDESTQKSQGAKQKLSKKPSEGESQSKKQSEGDKMKRKRNFGLVLSETQEVDLAEWIRANPMLYVRTMTAFKEGKKKKDLWADKADNIGVESGEILMTWYRSIRTRISKMLKDDMTSGAAALKRTDRDKFIDANFRFLRECIIRKEGRSAVQLKIKSATPQYSDSEDEEDDHNPDQPEEYDGEEPESSGVVPDVPTADVPTLPPKKKETKGKTGGRGRVKGTKRPLDDASEDDAEMGNMMQQLSQQQKAATAIQGRIEGLLTKDQQSSAAAWGTWMGTLAQQIDVRLHPAMYRQATDMMLDFIAQSAKLPTRVPGQEIFIPIQQPQVPTPEIFIPPQDVDQDVPQPVRYQMLVAQDVPYQHPAPQWNQPQHWNTPAPSAGRQEARPASTPVNLSMSFSNISGSGLPSMDGSLSEMLLQVPDPSTADLA